MNKIYLPEKIGGENVNALRQASYIKPARTQKGR
jgi:hypothetical protein